MNHVRRNESQILGNKGQAAQFLFRRQKEIRGRTGHPLAEPGVGSTHGHVPGSGEAPEMVQPDYIDMR